jgi:tetratricopeptide (TPR) repeat protein
MNQNQSIKQIFSLAFENHKANKLKIAEQYYKDILKIEPNHFDTNFLLGSLYLQSQKFEKSKSLFEKALQINPNNTEVYNNLGIICGEMENSLEGINYFKKAIEINPNNINALNNLGTEYYNMGKIQESIDFHQKANKIEPNNVLALNKLALAFNDLKEFTKAKSLYEEIIKINPRDFQAYNNIGLVFSQLNQPIKAIESFKKAIEIKPDLAEAHSNLGRKFKELGNLEKSINSYEKAIRYRPENFIYYFYLSDLKKDILNLELKKKIISNIKLEKLTKKNIAFGNYLLARYERKDKNYEKEINYLIEGHKNFISSKAKKFELGINYIFKDIFKIIQGATFEGLGKINNYNVKPIFIVGVPRCGSTLLEKIIGSGEKTIPLGEETTIFESFINTKILQRKSLNLGNIENVRVELLDIYKKKRLASEKNEYVFTDKSLNNFFYLKLIQKIFPQAKIIDIRRNALSSIMSIFQNNLSNLAWAHDIQNIFKYFDNYFKIMNIFKKNNPGHVYEIEFEKLIDLPEAETKKLFEHCKLPWNIKCLEFYKRKDLYSKTASNIQIRQAIYKNASEKYLPYKNLLYKYGKNYSWFNK